jgi:two-component system, OmpR family, response regulator
MALRVLLIDDDDRFRGFLAQYLERAGFGVIQAADGASGLRCVREMVVDIIVLDVVMPGLDGHEVLRKLRDLGSTPVLFLSAKGDEADRIAGLLLGGDDYVAKPCSAREIAIRLRTILRRSSPMRMASLAFGALQVDIEHRRVELDGQQVALTATEMDLLAVLVREPGRTLSRSELRARAGRATTVVDDRTLDVHIHRLRSKLRLQRPASVIETVRGVGYVFIAGE